MNPTKRTKRTKRRKTRKNTRRRRGGMFSWGSKKTPEPQPPQPEPQPEAQPETQPETSATTGTKKSWLPSVKLPFTMPFTKPKVVTLSTEDRIQKFQSELDKDLDYYKMHGDNKELSDMQDLYAAWNLIKKHHYSPSLCIYDETQKINTLNIRIKQIQVSLDTAKGDAKTRLDTEYDILYEELRKSNIMLQNLEAVKSEVQL